MSKLSDAIDVRQTHRIRPDETGNLVSVDVKDETHIIELFGTKVSWEYRIGTSFHVNVYCRDVAELPHIKKQAARMIIEEVFGEFRKPLYELENLIMCGDRAAARQKLFELMTSMGIT